MKKKKIIVLVSSLVMMFTVGCGRQNSGSDTTALTEEEIQEIFFSKAMSLTSTLQELASDEGYYAVVMPSIEIKEVLQSFAASDISVPEKITECTFNETELRSCIEPQADVALSDTSWKVLSKRLTSSFLNIVNSTYGGATVLAASSVLSVEETFSIEGIANEQAWLMDYGTDYGVGVTFCNTGDDIITVTARYVLIPESEEALLAVWEQESSGKAVEFSTIKKEEIQELLQKR